jgi:acyclic terpene utilization AtuA family protein
MTGLAPADGLRTGQFSAFFGDREDGFGQLIRTGVDVLVGDYLAELTMLVLKKNQLRGRPGYATTFPRQIGPYLPDIASAGIKVVTNAGGLDPLRCAEDLRALIREQGLDLTVAAIVGDDILDRLQELQRTGVPFANVDTGEKLALDLHTVLNANGYLGAWPIARALSEGADIVVCPRVTDASLIMGPAIWHFGWREDDWGPLAGSLAAGHVIECGAQATGGQFSMFDEFPDLGLPGMPIATIRDDGSFVVTKAADTGGVVTVDTVKAQLLYEIGSPLYHNPDVIADFSSMTVEQIGPDAVLVGATAGRPPTDSLKVSLAFEGGFRNSATVGITGGRVEQKLAWLQRQVHAAVGPAESFDGCRWTVIGPVATEDPATYEASTALATIAVKDRDATKVGRQNFANRITQIGVSNIPGFYLMSPPSGEQMFGVYWPTLVPKSAFQAEVVTGDGRRIAVPWFIPDEGPATAVTAVSPAVATGFAASAGDELVTVPLRQLVGTRSGDKGGNANLGVWGHDERAYAWLETYLTVERFAALLPEVAGLHVERYELANLLALNFVIYGFLDDGVASCLRIDAQAKGMGEYLGSHLVEVPRSLLAVR